jgi:hypothetical protein
MLARRVIIDVAGGPDRIRARLRHAVDEAPGFWAEFGAGFVRPLGRKRVEPVRFAGHLDGSAFRLRTVWERSWPAKPTLVVAGELQPAGAGTRVTTRIGPSWDSYLAFAPVVAAIAWVACGMGTFAQIRPFLAIAAVAVAFWWRGLRAALELAEDAFRKVISKVDQPSSRTR